MVSENDGALAALNRDDIATPAPEAASPPSTGTLGPEFMAPRYDRVEQVVHKEWNPNAPMGRVVADAVSRLPEDSEERHVVNVVRRAFYAHRRRPWKAETEYPAGVTLIGADGQTYAVTAAGRSGLELEPDGAALRLKREV